MLYVDNEAWGSQAHIHLLTVARQIIIPYIAKHLKIKRDRERPDDLSNKIRERWRLGLEERNKKKEVNKR